MATESHEDKLARYARALPMAAVTAYGLGPLALPAGETAEDRLHNFARSRTGVLAAIDSAGATAGLILRLVSHYGGSLTAARLAYETAAADLDDVSAAVDRLCDIGLLIRNHGDDLVASPALSEILVYETVSLSDQNAITSEALSLLCRRLQLKPVSNKKQDKIDAIAELFGDSSARSAVYEELSNEAKKALQRIADADGLRPVGVEVLGLSRFDLRHVEAPRYNYQPLPPAPAAAALAELCLAGIIGVSEYEGQVWIWSETWPLLDRPLYRQWPESSRPTIVQCAPTPVRVPGVVALFDQLLRHWETSPPAVLKNGDHRLGKPLVRATAKSIDSTETVVELLSSLAMAMELLRSTVVSRSGRGRNSTVVRAWMADADAYASWLTLAPLRKWMNMIGYWTRSAPAWGDQLLANRLLLLWELASIEPQHGFESSDELARWIDDRYRPVGVAPAVLEALADLRTLDVISVDGPVMLTDLGRLAITDYLAVDEISLSQSEQAIVQADLTVTAPPDLKSTLVAQLKSIATLESDAGALVYRLDEAAITTAVQRGETEDSITEFLITLSSVPVDASVFRFVADAAAKAEKVRIVAAPSVLVTSDPVDLVLALGLKSAKLTPVTPTVAFSSLPAEKLRSILAKKGLSPRMVADTTTNAEVRSSSDRAAELEERAQYYGDLASKHQQNRNLKREAARLMAAAAVAKDPSSKWTKHRSFAIGAADVAAFRSPDPVTEADHDRLPF